MNRRGFLTDISIGLSALVFTPKLIQARWKQLPNEKIWVPHWAFLSERWRHEQRRLNFLEAYGVNEMPLEFPFRMLAINGDAPVFLRHKFYEEMYPVVMAASGIIVEPFEHMPINWKPLRLIQEDVRCHGGTAILEPMPIGL